MQSKSLNICNFYQDLPLPFFKGVVFPLLSELCPLPEENHTILKIGIFPWWMIWLHSLSSPEIIFCEKDKESELQLEVVSNFFSCEEQNFFSAWEP